MDIIKGFSTRAYGARAEEDFFNASVVISQRCGTPRAGIFWCEQAIERYSKHVIALQYKDATVLACQHDLTLLMKEAGFSVSDEERILFCELNNVPSTLYPQGVNEFVSKDMTWEDAESALVLVRRVRDWCVVLRPCP